MHMRALNEKDWSVLRVLRLDALREHPEAFGSSFEEESQMTEEQFGDGLKACDMFGAFVGNELIGCVGFFMQSGTKMRHRGVLFSMYVQPKHRGAGVADALVTAVVSHAKKRVLQLHVTVVTSNQAALKLYLKHRFSIYGTEPRALKVDDRFYDEHMMVLEL